MAGTSRELSNVMEENDNRLDSTVRIKIRITDGARSLVGKRGDTAMPELFFPFK